MKNFKILLLAAAAMICGIGAWAQERIVEIVKDGEVVFSSLASEIEYMTVVNCLPSPTNFETTVTGSAVTITWDAVEGATSYDVLRSEDFKNFGKIGTTEVARFVDTSPLKGTSYYGVIARGKDGAKSLNCTIYAQVHFVGDNGCRIYVNDLTGWDEILMYAWGYDLPELFGGWPGLPATGSETINGVNYLYWDCGESNNGLHYNFIANNNNGRQIENNNVLSVTLNKDYYFRLNPDLTVEAIDPENPGEVVDPVNPGEVVDPVEPNTGVEGPTYKLYVDDRTGWSAFAVYAWGDKEMFGRWPGVLSEATETIDGISYKVFSYKGLGEEINLIFNNNGGGTQLPDYHIVADRNYYLRVTSDGVSEIKR